MAHDFAQAQELDIREQAAAHTLAANPLVGVRTEDLVASARLLLSEMLNHPAVAMRQWLALLAEFGRIATGDSALAPDPKDRCLPIRHGRTTPSIARWRNPISPGATRYTAFSMKPRSIGAMPNVRIF